MLPDLLMFSELTHLNILSLSSWPGPDSARLTWLTLSRSRLSQLRSQRLSSSRAPGLASPGTDLRSSHDLVPAAVSRYPGS